jgi:hypothetical protein
MMLKQTLMIAVLAMPGALLINAVAAPVASAEKEIKTHEGLVASVSEGKLVMTDKDGKNEHTHSITAKTTITLNGKMAKLADLKKGDTIKVTMTGDAMVTMVEAKRIIVAL